MEDMGTFCIARSSRRQTTCTALFRHLPRHDIDRQNPIKLAMVRHFPPLLVGPALSGTANSAPRAVVHGRFVVVRIIGCACNYYFKR